MFRIVGFVIGSLVSLAALVLLVGMPEFHLVDDTAVGKRVDVPDQQPENVQETPPAMELPATATPDATPRDAVDTVAERTEPEEPGAHLESTVGAASRRDETVSGRRSAATCRSLDGCPEDPEHLETTAGPDAAETERAGTMAALPIDTGPETPAEPRWRTFWNPFRSRVAAEGFIGRLASVTGLDYRVVKAGTGVYQVQFSYSDEAELDRKLSQIAAATGLDLANRPP